MENQYCPYCMTPVEPDKACPSCGLTYGAYSPSAHHLPPGTILKERYIIGRVLGEGGFGITYLGCDMRLELRVAVKEYFPTDKANRVSSASLSVSNYFGVAGDRYKEGKTRFLQEARTMARMDKQPVIVSVRDFFEANNTAYIVMEYIDGTTFKELVEQRGGRIPAGELLYTIEPLFYALSAMHDRGLIHRDISPENLMLENGEIRLLDFGCAREAQSGDATLTIALKHGYAPVEQYQNKGQGPWTDVYALSATIYYCLTGRKPPQSMDRLVEDELILPRKLGVDLTEQQERALLFGMGIRPRRRYQSVQELHAALYEGVELGGGQIAKEKVSRETDRKTDDSRNNTQNSSNTRPSGQGRTINDKTQVPAEENKRTFGGWLRKNRVLAGGIAALLVGGVALGIVLSQRASVPVSAPEPEPTVTVTAAPTATLTAAPTATPTPRPTPAPTSEPTPEPFENAARLPEDGSLDEEIFRAFMDSEQIEAIVLPSGSGLDIESGPLEITKPLLIEEGAGINDLQPITVRGDGLIRIEGELWTDGLVRTVDGGSIVVASTGEWGGCAAVWLENEKELLVEPNGSLSSWGIEYGSEQSGERFIVLNEEALFADATHVSSFAEFQEAISNERTTAIVIDGDFTITDADRAHGVPVLISEGVTVTAPATEGRELDWIVNASVLVNRGTLQGSLNVGDFDDDETAGVSTVVNYGTIDATLWINCAGPFVNLGEMDIYNCQMYLANVYNLGTMTLDHSSSFVDILCPTFYNYGEIVADDERFEQGELARNIRISNGVRFVNCGIMRFGRGGELYNNGYLENAGQLLFTDAFAAFDNNGCLASVASCAALDMHEEARLDNTGLILYGYDSEVRLSGAADEDGGHQVAFRWGDTAVDPKKVRMCSSTADFLDALKDDSCEIVAVPGECRIEISGDLTIEKVVALASQSALVLDGGNLTVSGEKAFLHIDSEMNLGGGALSVQDGAAMLIRGRGFNCGEIRLDGGAVLVSQNRLETASGATVALDNGSRLVNLGYLTLDQATVRVNDGLLCSTNWLELLGCQVEIGKNGELLTEYSSIYMDEATEIVNRNFIRLRNNGMFETFLNGRITNEATMCVSAGQAVVLGGSLINSGRMTLENVTVTGTVENRGRIGCVEDTLSRIGGTWSGNDAETIKAEEAEEWP